MGFKVLTASGAIKTGTVPTTDVSSATGTLVVAHGGTGDTTLTAHGVLIGEGTSAVAATAVGTTGQILTGVSGADPVWATPAATGGAALADFRHAFVAPINGNYAWVNQSGTASVRDDTDSVVMIGDPVGNISNWNMRVLASPGVAYTLIVNILPLLQAKASLEYGVVWRASGSGNFVVISNNYTGGSLPNLKVRKYTSPTVFSADYFTTIWPHDLRWFKLVDDAVNRSVYASSDGVDWMLLHTVGRTDFITPNQIGFGVEGSNAATPNVAPIIRVLSWEVTTP